MRVTVIFPLRIHLFYLAILLAFLTVGIVVSAILYDISFCIPNDFFSGMERHERSPLFMLPIGVN